MTTAMSVGHGGEIGMTAIIEGAAVSTAMPAGVSMIVAAYGKARATAGDAGRSGLRAVIVDDLNRALVAMCERLVDIVG